MITFNWLHLTDLHHGASGQPPLWPNVRQAFFTDLAKLHEPEAVVLSVRPPPCPDVASIWAAVAASIEGLVAQAGGLAVLGPERADGDGEGGRGNGRDSPGPRGRPPGTRGCSGRGLWRRASRLHPYLP
jgi:hypothetical protein